MKKTLLATALLLLISNANSYGQCNATAFLTPKSISNNNTLGLRSWSNLGNLLDSDNSYTNVVALLIGDKTHYLYGVDYGFNIPPTATICGIEVRVERAEGGLLANVTDHSVKIVKGGNISGTEHALAAGWTSADAVASYGSPTDTWGLGWTPADINSNSFGLAFSANLGGVAVLPSARIDQISIRVWYNNILPVELTHFEPSCQDDEVALHWETATETQNDYFAVQHSDNGIDFTTVKTITGSGTTSTAQQYNYSHRPDAAPQHYYRLVQYDFNGDSAVYAPKAVECGYIQPTLQVYQPQQGAIHISLNGFSKTVQVALIDLSGNVLYQAAAECSNSRQNISVQNNAALKPGCYLVTATCTGGKTYSQKIMVLQ